MTGKEEAGMRGEGAGVTGEEAGVTGRGGGRDGGSAERRWCCLQRDTRGKRGYDGSEARV